MMPDIAMCRGEADGRVCPHRKICYRATATPSDDRQGYFHGMPLKSDDSCEYFDPNGLHDHQDCPCGHPPGAVGPCAGCNCADKP